MVNILPAARAGGSLPHVVPSQGHFLSLMPFKVHFMSRPCMVTGQGVPLSYACPLPCIYIVMPFLHFFGYLLEGGEDLGNDMPFPGICSWETWWLVPCHHCPVAESERGSCCPQPFLTQANTIPWMSNAPSSCPMTVMIFGRNCNLFSSSSLPQPIERRQ